MYIVRLEKNRKVTYTEFDDKRKAIDFTVLGVAYGWCWDLYRITKD